ncbi:MAG: hypothetical protein WKF77_21215 [Planctomycetaceae bacterium]
MSISGNRRIFPGVVIALQFMLILEGPLVHADDTSQVITEVERQPFVAATRRLVEAMDFAGEPFSDDIRQKITDVAAMPADKDAVKQLQLILDPLCLAFVNINAESRVKVAEGPVKKELMQQGWRAFLIKVHNEAGINPVLLAESPNALPVYQQGRGPREEPRKNQTLVNPEDVPDRFLDLNMLKREPLKDKLSGLLVEYRVLLLYSRDAGQREASLSFHIGAGTQDIGFRNAVPILFDCKSAVALKLQIHDVDGEPTTANFIVRDTKGRVYPLPSRRLAPDFFFHDQVYRSDGESIMLPPGDYSLVVNRGPEYLPQRLTVAVTEEAEQTVAVDLKRWIHVAKHGWYSGDHHVHAAGCATTTARPKASAPKP